MTGASFGLYVHVPFCAKKCTYCDFVSYPVSSFDTSRYCSAVAREIEMILEGSGWPRELRDHAPRSLRLEGMALSTLFVGGGTPTILSVDDLATVLDAVKLLPISGATDSCCGVVESTVEANPGTLTAGGANRLRNMGINRISIGLQTTSEDHLAMLGRTHSYSDFLSAFHAARSAGFDNISVDLIYGLPGQTRAEWLDDVSSIVELGPEHVSCYALTLADGTSLCEAVTSGLLPMTPDDLVADMYFDAVSVLTSSGYVHYEISNFAVPGMECRHNQNYWKNGYYVGVGAAAHSHLPGIRYENTRNVQTYVEAVEACTLPVADMETLSLERELSDALILGLRTRSGVDVAQLSARYGRDAVSGFLSRLEKLKKTGLVEITTERVRLTERGMILSNQVMMELL